MFADRHLVFSHNGITLEFNYTGLPDGSGSSFWTGTLSSEFNPSAPSLFDVFLMSDNRPILVSPTLTRVPTPAALPLFGLALAGLLAARARRRG